MGTPVHVEDVLTQIAQRTPQQEASHRKSSRAKDFLFVSALCSLQLIATPYVLLHKLTRRYLKKASHETDLRRWFVRSQRVQQKDRGPRVVFLSPSNGELRLVERLTKHLEQLRPNIDIVWAIRDYHSLEIARQLNPDRSIVLWPFDHVIPLVKWMKLVSPDLIVVPEKFWIPNLVGVSKLHGVKLAVINGRTYRKNRPYHVIKRGYYRWIAQSFDVLCVQSAEFARYLEPLVRDKTMVAVTGNLKLDLGVQAIAPQQLESLNSWLATRAAQPLLAAGSTNGTSDEAFLIEAFSKVRSSVACSLMVAPRHLERVEGSVRAFRAAGFSVNRRSDQSPVPADVYMLDTIGELSNAYRFATAVFIGGTVDSNGHNVMEPVHWGVPVSYGPQRGHFEDLQKLCESNGVGFRCFQPDDLAAHWMRVLGDDALQSEIRARCASLSEHSSGATAETISHLDAIINGIGCRN